MMLEMNKLSGDATAEGGFKDSSGANADLEQTDGENDSSQTDIAAPMTLIVIFLVVEIWPIWLVLDGNFVDIFLKYSVLIE